MKVTFSLKGEINTEKVHGGGRRQENDQKTITAAANDQKRSWQPASDVTQESEVMT
jgi:hypothetical protein